MKDLHLKEIALRDIEIEDLHKELGALKSENERLQSDVTSTKSLNMKISTQNHELISNLESFERISEALEDTKNKLAVGYI